MLTKEQQDKLIGAYYRENNVKIPDQLREDFKTSEGLLFVLRKDLPTPDDIRYQDFFEDLAREYFNIEYDGYDLDVEEFEIDEELYRRGIGIDVDHSFQEASRSNAVVCRQFTHSDGRTLCNVYLSSGSWFDATLEERYAFFPICDEFLLRLHKTAITNVVTEAQIDDFIATRKDR